MKTLSFIIFALVIGSGIANATPSTTRDVTLSWTNPIDRADGTLFDPATEQMFVRVYADCGSGSALYAEIATAISWAATVPIECQYWTVAAVDTDSYEGASAEPQVFFKAPPGQIKDLTN